MRRSELSARVTEVSLLRGDFHLRSGAAATEYFDKYRFEARPELLSAIANGLAPLIPAGTGALAGLELGGVPIATALSLQTGIPVRFVRKRAKDYGTRRLAEGGDIDGLRLVIVEDVVTTGGQVLESCRALRQLGAVVDDVLCVIDRESGGKEALLTEGLRLQALFHKYDMLPEKSGSSRAWTMP